MFSSIELDRPCWRRYSGAVILPQAALYALRAMAQLAVLPRDVPVRTTDLSALTGVPAPFLAKVLRRLVAVGLLRSGKGHGGGFTLARPAREIRYADILGALEVELAVDNCAFGWGKCDAQHPCLLHPTISQLKTAQARWARNITLADAVAGNAPKGLRKSPRAEPATEKKQTRKKRRRSAAQ